MSDPVAKAKEPQDRALKRNEQAREAVKQERAALWAGFRQKRLIWQIL